MKKQSALIFGILSLLTISSAFAKDGWLDNFEKAKAESKSEKKFLFLDFTGSDWCGWCIKIDKDIFSKPDFQEYAKEKLVLMEVDFPHSKALPNNVKTQNDKLQQTYHIDGFPTLILLNPAGKEVKRWVGYNPAMLSEIKAVVGGK